MVVVAIVAIVTMIALPSWRHLMLANRIRGVVNDFALAASFARAEAVRRNTQVIFCPSTNGSACTSSDYEQGWIVKTGGVASAPADVILQDYQPVDFVTITSNKSSRITGISYLSNGLPIGNFAGFRITIQPRSGPDASLNRYLCVSRTGRVRVFNETDYLALPASACG